MPWRVFAGVVVLTGIAAATDPADKLDFEMPESRLEVHVYNRDTVAKPDLLPEEARRQQAPPEAEDPTEALRHEVETIRDELRLLQDTLNLMINQIMADLREENETLRQEIRRMHAARDTYGLPDLSGIPRPESRLIEEVLAEGDFDAQPVPGETLLEDEELPTPEEFLFTAVHEWGRTPEMVQELGENATTLKGVVGVVPRGSRREDIEQLGRDLRNEFADYDNINIEVFDDVTAATQFIETRTTNPERRVLSVSKHSASDRDMILYLERGNSHEVPLNTQTSPE